MVYGSRLGSEQVEAFNPGFGAPQLAQTLFGVHNRFGKLPYTMYLLDPANKCFGLQKLTLYIDWGLPSFVVVRQN